MVTDVIDLLSKPQPFSATKPPWRALLFRRRDADASVGVVFLSGPSHFPEEREELTSTLSFYHHFFSSAVLFLSSRRGHQPCRNDLSASIVFSLLLYPILSTLFISKVLYTFIMSGMSFSSGKQHVKPPQRGIFPLDHDAECKPAMEVSNSIG